MFSETTYVQQVDNAMIFITAVSAVLLIVITALMIYFVIRYNRKRHPIAVQIEGNTKLEIAWTVIPIIIVMVMFWYGYIGYDTIMNPPADAYKIQVTGKMWVWEFNYPNGIKSDTLFVPYGKPIQCDLKSLDVNHSFYIPALRFKKDVMANRPTKVWFQPEKVGSYDIACAEYCGLNHWNMYTKLVVMPQADYDKWYAAEFELQKPTVATTATAEPTK